MADPIVHSVARPPKTPEANTPNNSVNPRVAELLQSIYAVSRTAATSMGLGKAIDSAGDRQGFVNPDEVVKFSLEEGYEAINRVCSDAEELARLLAIDLRKPDRYTLNPVFDDK